MAPRSPFGFRWQPTGSGLVIYKTGQNGAVRSLASSPRLNLRVLRFRFQTA
ncbi:hypothetical protein BN903_36 [Halorubrum sp. AJ67]|nr:hypothetical protein BN903_36 [Halorubrum sp. AJ67]